MLASHILVTALTSASSTHVSIAVVLGKICRLGLWKHNIKSKNEQKEKRVLGLDLFV